MKFSMKHGVGLCTYRPSLPLSIEKLQFTSAVFKQFGRGRLKLGLILPLQEYCSGCQPGTMNTQLRELSVNQSRNRHIYHINTCQ